MLSLLSLQAIKKEILGEDDDEEGDEDDDDDDDDESDDEEGGAAGQGGPPGAGPIQACSILFTPRRTYPAEHNRSR